MSEINLDKQKKPEGFFTIKNIGIIILFLSVSAFFFGFGLGISKYVFGDTNGSVQALPSESLTAERIVSPDISQNNISYIFDDVSRSVVSVNNTQIFRDFLFNNIERTSQGSGVIMDQDESLYIIITNNHVVENAAKIEVIMANYYKTEASLLGYDQQSDLAFLGVEKAGLPEEVTSQIKVATLGDSDRLRVGEKVLAIGNPLGITNTVTDGIISGLQRNLNFADRSLRLIQTNAAINPGNSGGALVNMNAEIIGINTIKIAGAQVEGLAFAIPINHAIAVYEEIMEKGYVSRPFLGIIGSDISAGSGDYPFDAGVLVRGIIERSAAEIAGMREGDIIVEFNGNKILEMEDLIEAINQTKAGDQVTVTIIREGRQPLTITVKMLEREAP